MKQIIGLVIVMCMCLSDVQSQSYGFGIKGGPTIGLQQWNGFSGRDPLIRYHFAAFIESHRDDPGAVIFAQAGYHIKGSTLRTRAYFNPFSMQNVQARSSNMQFKNASLLAGIKQKFQLNRFLGYYLLGIRGEYTISTEMEGFLSIYQDEELHNDFLVGLTAGGGIELPLGRFVSGLLELSVSPDISKQIFIPQQDTGYTDPISGQPIILRQQDVSNVAIEISLGLRFLHEITYID